MLKDKAAERRGKLRTFGLLLGFFLAVVGWRLRAKGHPVFAPPLWALALASSAAAWFSPARLDGLERRWMGVARAIGRVNAFVVLTLVYYALLTPFAFVMRALAGDPLERAWGAGSYWKNRTSGEDKESYRRQF